jgi:hypothetical protein
MPEVARGDPSGTLPERRGASPQTREGETTGGLSGHHGPGGRTRDHAIVAAAEARAVADGDDRGVLVGARGHQARDDRRSPAAAHPQVIRPAHRQCSRGAPKPKWNLLLVVRVTSGARASETRRGAAPYRGPAPGARSGSVPSPSQLPAARAAQGHRLRDDRSHGGSRTGASSTSGPTARAVCRRTDVLLKSLPIRLI